MARTTVQEVLDRVKQLLMDPTSIRWTQAELVDWFNAGQIQIVIDRPDANAVTEDFNCAAATLQTIPEHGMRFIRVVRNADTSKKAIRLAMIDEMDEIIPDWHDDTNPAGVVDHYLFDERSPREFYVYPCPGTNLAISITYSQAPEKVLASALDAVLPIGDEYAEVIIQYVLYRAYSKDAKFNGDKGQAQASWAMYNNLLGTKGQADRDSSPNSRMNPRNGMGQ